MPVLPALPVTAITMASVRARAARPAKIVERVEGVGDAHQPLLIAGREAALDDGTGGARLERRGDEGMTVAVLPADGDEAFAGAETAAIDGEARDGRGVRARARAACGGHNLPYGPERISQVSPLQPARQPPRRGRKTG